jgi:hypothetical protein
VPVCYAVIDTTDGPASLRLRHRVPHAEFDSVSTPGFERLCLAVEVMHETGGSWQYSIRAIAAGGVTGLSARTGRYNRAGTALAHRLGAPAGHRVYGPLILYGGTDHSAGSLSDQQLRLLSGFLSVINASIHGPAAAGSTISRQAQSAGDLTNHFGASTQCL